MPNQLFENLFCWFFCFSLSPNILFFCPIPFFVNCDISPNYFNFCWFCYFFPLLNTESSFFLLFPLIWLHVSVNDFTLVLGQKTATRIKDSMAVNCFIDSPWPTSDDTTKTLTGNLYRGNTRFKVLSYRGKESSLILDLLYTTAHGWDVCKQGSYNNPRWFSYSCIVIPCSKQYIMQYKTKINNLSTL